MQSKPRNPILEAAGADLVRKLGGLWHGDRGMCLCPAHADKRPSLSVRVGDQSLLFKCFAGCSTINVLRELNLLRIRVPTDTSNPIRPSPHIETDPMRTRARQIWGEASPITGGPAGRYLLSRGIDIRPPALRFHPRAPFGRGRGAQFRPAIIAAVVEAGRFMGIQRLFLERDGSGLATDLEKPKWGLARPLGGAVQLLPAGPVLGLAEGIETAISAAMLLDIPVWAALGSERLHRITIPPTVRRLVLLPDKDRAGRIAVARAHAAYAERPFALDLLWPWSRQNDWNDVLMRPHLWEVRVGESRVRIAA